MSAPWTTWTAVGLSIFIIIIVICLATWKVKRMRCPSTNSVRRAQQTNEGASYTTFQMVSAVPAAVAANYESIYTARETDRRNITFESWLWEGSFSELWKGLLIHPDSTLSSVMIKQLEASASDEVKQNFQKELEIRKNLASNPFVVKMLAFCTESDPHLIVFEMMEKENLKLFLCQTRSNHVYSNLHGSSSSLTSDDLVRFAHQVAQGMNYLATNKLILRYLAAEKVLRTSENVCKIYDFDNAAEMQETGEYIGQAKRPLSIRWMAPESIFDSIYTTKSDVWSFGILLYEIVTLGRMPYPGLSEEHVKEELEKGYQMRRPKHCSDEIFKIMEECWNKDPTKRPSFEQLCDMLKNMCNSTVMYITIVEDTSYEEIDSATMMREV